MSDDKKDNSDITRIEDLSEYEHEEFEGTDEDPDSSLMDAQTDPNIQLPEEFRPSEKDPSDDDEGPNFEDLENQEDTAANFESDEFDSSNDFNSDDFDSSDFVAGPNEDTSDEFSDDFSTDFSEDFSDEQEDHQEFAPELEEETVEEKEKEKEKEESFENDDFGLSEDVPNVKEEPRPISKTPSNEYKAPETFQELQKFAKNIDYGSLASEGNPPFSVALKGVKYKEDAQDILALLKEFDVVKDADTESALKSLERGSFLIPRLGEYSAITICHKLRRFDVEILMGLTEEVRPPKSYRSDDSGLASKHTVYNSRSHHFRLDKDDLDPQTVLVATTPYLESHDVIEYIAIASENTLIDSKTLEGAHSLEEQLISTLPDYQKEKKHTEQIFRQNQAASESSPIENILDLDAKKPAIPRVPSLAEIQNSLIQKLRIQAAQAKGNALIGINFHVTPLGELHQKSGAQFQVICSGSIVWVNKR